MLGFRGLQHYILWLFDELLTRVRSRCLREFHSRLFLFYKASGFAFWKLSFMRLAKHWDKCGPSSYLWSHWLAIVHFFLLEQSVGYYCVDELLEFILVLIDLKRTNFLGLKLCKPYCLLDVYDFWVNIQLFKEFVWLILRNSLQLTMDNKKQETEALEDSKALLVVVDRLEDIEIEGFDQVVQARFSLFHLKWLGLGSRLENIRISGHHRLSWLCVIVALMVLCLSFLLLYERLSLGSSRLRSLIIENWDFLLWGW